MQLCPDQEAGQSNRWVAFHTIKLSSNRAISVNLESVQSVKHLILPGTDWTFLSSKRVRNPNSPTSGLSSSLGQIDLPGTMERKSTRSSRSFILNCNHVSHPYSSMYLEPEAEKLLCAVGSRHESCGSNHKLHMCPCLCRNSKQRCPPHCSSSSMRSGMSSYPPSLGRHSAARVIAMATTTCNAQLAVHISQLLFKCHPGTANFSSFLARYACVNC